MSWIGPSEPAVSAAPAAPAAPALPALTRPQLAEARRLRAAQLLAQGWTNRQIADALGVTAEAARRWRLAWTQGGTAALRRRQASGRPAALAPHQLAAIHQALLAGAQASGFATDLWTLDRVAHIVERTTGIRVSTSSAWRLLRRLGWSRQVPERSAKERNDQAIARWVAHEWPRIKKGPPSTAPGSSASTNPASPCDR